jgi:hypothetical protein
MEHPTGPQGLRRRKVSASLLVAALLAALLVLVPGAAPASAAGGKVAAKGTLGDGYFFVATDGGIFNYGDSEFKGSTGDIKLNQPIVGAAQTPTGEGYWLVASDGGIFTFGDAVFYGSTGDIKLNKPIVAMVATPTGQGYWLFATDGGVFTFGDAVFYGSTGDIKLNKPIVGADSTPNGAGYYLVASDGGIFTFGDAVFYGSAGDIKLNKPIVGMAATDDGMGYYLVATDGGIFSYGKTPLDAPFFGSTGDIKLNQPIVGMDLSATNQGYYLVAADGGIFTFGDAVYRGSTGDIKLNKPIVGMRVTPVSPITAPDFVVNLRGAAQTAGGDADGSGFGLLDFTDDELCWVVSAENIAQATAMHIHRGTAGTDGPVVIDMGKLDNNGTGVACKDLKSDADKALIKEIMAFPQGFYLNVHNADFPSGAIRGQLAGHIGIGVTNTDATAKSAKVVLMDTENPAGAVVLRSVDTQGAPVNGVDFRPGTTDAYLLLTVGTVPTSNVDPTPTALVMQLVKSTAAGVTSSVGTPFTMNLASAFGFDFNPVADRIRVISDSGQNLRLNPDAAADASPVVATDTAIPAGFAGAAYTNNVKGAATTTLYDINYGNDSLFMQGGPDGTPSPNSGAVTAVGALGVDLGPLFGFDISPSPAGVTGTALVAGQVTGSTNSVLLAVNLATGKATHLGRIDTDATNGIQAFTILL